MFYRNNLSALLVLCENHCDEMLLLQELISESIHLLLLICIAYLQQATLSANSVLM